MDRIEWSDFERVEIRVGTILDVEPFPRDIAGFVSECLTLGVQDEEGEAILLSPTHAVPDGGRLY